jgi:hypothetical protein
MTGNELRELATQLLAISAKAGDRHARLARLLGRKLSPAERLATTALAGVQDCMARRYRQWATHLEEVAIEIDELE